MRRMQVLAQCTVGLCLGVFAVAVLAPPVGAEDVDVTRDLQGFDAYMEKIVTDWNVPGIGVGIVVGDKLVFAKGYGYRDYGKKLPFTPKTLFPIASNSKLFTAVAAGLLVEEGKLTWDKPVRESVPSIHFYNDQLQGSVTLRDMLAHRTGVTRHDLIWYRAADSRAELFNKLQYMEPQEPMRTIFLYNNMMYTSVGYMIELQTGKTWEDFVAERILEPLDMPSTTYSIAEMVKQPDCGVGYTERRDSFELYQIPYYEDTQGMAPCGAIISNIDEMSHWLIALMNDGMYDGKQVLPAAVLKATLEPSIALPNTLGETRGFWEMLNPAYGMGRWTASYRGHLYTYHGGDIDGFHSQVSFMPQDHVGVLTFVIGDHCAALYNIVTGAVYERLLGMDPTPWSERFLEIRLKGKKAGQEARARAGSNRVAGTKPSHRLAEYAGEYEHPAYGIMKIGLKGNQLQFDYHAMTFPMTHFHYDRFDTPDDERFGKWSVSFLTDPQGQVSGATMSLDEAEVTFKRRPESLDATVLARLAGAYETPTGFVFQIVADDAGLRLVTAGSPDERLDHYKDLSFRIPRFSDIVFTFVTDKAGNVTTLRQTTPSDEFDFARK